MFHWYHNLPRNRRLDAIAALIVLIALVRLSARYALAFPLWGDEAFLAVNFLERGFSGLGGPLEYGQVAPAGYLWLVWLTTRWLGYSEYALRLVSYLAGMATLVLYGRFCRSVAGRPAALLAVAFLATSFYPMRHSVEVKPYALDMLLSFMILDLGWRVWRARESARAWAALIGVTTLGVWCSYTAVFPAAGVFALLAFRSLSSRSLGTRAGVALYGLLLVGSWSLNMRLFSHVQMQEGSWLVSLSTWTNSFPPLSRPWQVPYWLLRVHTGNALAYPYGGNHFGSTLTFLLVMMGAVALWRRRRSRPLLLFLVSPLPFALLAAALHAYPYGTSARTMLYMAPSFCFLAGTGLASRIGARCSAWPPSRGPILAASALAVIPLCGIVLDLRMPYKNRDDAENRRLALQLAATMRPGDRCIVFNGASPPPDLPDLMLRQWMQQVAEFRFYLTRSSPVPIDWEPDPDQVAPAPGTNRTWFLVHQPARLAYPYERLADYHRRLALRLGPPRSVQRHGLVSYQEYVDVEEYAGSLVLK